MDTLSVSSYIFSGMPLNQFIAFYIFALVGLVISTGIELLAARKTIKESGGFNPAIWVLDNWLRIVVSMLVIAVGILFSEELLGIELSPFASLCSGFTTDKIIEALKLKLKK